MKLPLKWHETVDIGYSSTWCFNFAFNTDVEVFFKYIKSIRTTIFKLKSQTEAEITLLSLKNANSKQNAYKFLQNNIFPKATFRWNERVSQLTVFLLKTNIEIKQQQFAFYYFFFILSIYVILSNFYRKNGEQKNFICFLNLSNFNFLNLKVFFSPFSFFWYKILKKKIIFHIICFIYLT